MWIFTALGIISSLISRLVSPTHQIPAAQTVAVVPSATLIREASNLNAPEIMDGGTDDITQNQDRSIALVKQLQKEETVPIKVEIPEIGLTVPIVVVGLNDKQLVDVPEKLPGWYKGGVIPGEVGNATLQGHVTTVFGNLHKVNIGDEIKVINSNGENRKFTVVEKELIKKEDFDVQKVYGGTDKRRLNLITCAGNLINGDFDKRTIIYSEVIQ